jgi:hypothetical protein
MKKYFEIHMHFIRKFIQDGVIILKYLSTKEKFANIFTKKLASPHFLQLQSMLGVKEFVLSGSS